MSVSTSSAGKPARISSVLSPTDKVPTRNAATNASAPMLIGRNVASAKITTSARLLTISGDTSGSYGVGGRGHLASVDQWPSHQGGGHCVTHHVSACREGLVPAPGERPASCGRCAGPRG